MKNETTKSTAYTIFVWGALWGIFEATVGYLLHLLPFSIGWLIWYPVACFFMANVYRVTRKTSSIVLVGFLCASIKLLNLLLPGRIDKVINPALSIVFEALAMAAVLFVFHARQTQKPQSLLHTAAMFFFMNTGWRLLFSLYLLFLVPDWMREVSVVASAEKFIPFFVLYNIGTTALLTAGYRCKKLLLRPILFAENGVQGALQRIALPYRPVLQTATACVLLLAFVLLDFLL